MSKLSRERGSGFIEVLLVLAVIGAIVFIGLKVVGSHTKAPVPSGGTTTAVAVPASVTSKADLQKASAALDATSVSNVDLSQLDSDLNSLL